MVNISLRWLFENYFIHLFSWYDKIYLWLTNLLFPRESLFPLLLLKSFLLFLKLSKRFVHLCIIKLTLAVFFFFSGTWELSTTRRRYLAVEDRCPSATTTTWILTKYALTLWYYGPADLRTLYRTVLPCRWDLTHCICKVIYTKNSLNDSHGCMYFEI